MARIELGALPTKYEILRAHLKEKQYRWAITGVAGFIGSHLLETLLKLNQHVIGIDNFSTGSLSNLIHVRDAVDARAWSRFILVEDDICNYQACRYACTGTEFVLHQAALGSVSRSIEDPIRTNESNVNGFLTMLVAARDTDVSRLVFAGSSSVYGDHPGLPKLESVIGHPLSPYAVTKYVNELYADAFHRCYGLDFIGLRYFNVFGPRQDPNGDYAAVIPKWISALIKNESVFINGDGETSRDFCFVENVVQANLLAALTKDKKAINQIYNVALNDRISLNALYELMRSTLGTFYPHVEGHRPVYRKFRAGDIRHSQADITKAQSLLAFKPTHDIRAGLVQTIDWYRANIDPPLPKRRKRIAKSPATDTHARTG